MPFYHHVIVKVHLKEDDGREHVNLYNGVTAKPDY
jgi:hypothetical protein